MRSFIPAVVTLFFLCAFIVWYGVCLGSFSDELTAKLNSLPESVQALEQTDEDVLARCDAILEQWKGRELFIHLAVPYERMESMHEKLLSLREAYAAGAYADFCVYRALCLEETEILRGFEAVNLPNLV